MKQVEVLIQGDGATLRSPQASRFVEKEADDFPRQMEEVAAEAGIKNRAAIFFVSENLLFFKNFDLPLKTQNLKEAITYQLNMIVPFPEESYYYSFAATRDGKNHHVHLYAVQRQHVDRYLQAAADAGYTIDGLFPESQKYLTRAARKESWTLYVPGHPGKAFVFGGQSLADRLLFHVAPDPAALRETTACEAVYHTAPPAEGGFLDAALLLEKPPLLKEHNLLPSFYRQPDYYRMIIIAFAALNILGLIFLGGIKITKLRSFHATVDREIEKIMPMVKEVKKLQEEEKRLTDSLAAIQELGHNYDFIRILQLLTTKMPPGSYLDQIRLDKKSTALVIQGYTDDIGSLTSSLKEIGDAKLKSTSRRKDKTYFQLEITLS